MASVTTSLYQIADAEIRLCIDAYLTLAKATRGLTQVRPQHLTRERTRSILLAGLGVLDSSISAREACEEWKRRQALTFDLEAAITFGVYRDIRIRSVEFLDSVERATTGFTKFDSEFIRSNPHVLPILQHVSGVFSKSALKKHVGSVSDTGISKPAAERLAKLLRERVLDPKSINKGEILQRLEGTLGGNSPGSSRSRIARINCG